MPHRYKAPLGAPCWIDLFTSDPDAAEGVLRPSCSAGRPRAPGRSTAATSPSPRTARRSPVACSNDGSQGSPTVVRLLRQRRRPGRPSTPPPPTADRCTSPPMEVPAMGTMAMLGDPGGAASGCGSPARHQGFAVLGEPGTPNWFELHTSAYDASRGLLPQRLRLGHPHDGRRPRVPLHDARRGRRRSWPGSWTPRRSCPTACPAQWRSTSASRTPTPRWPRITELGGTIVDAAEDTPYGRLATAADTTGTRFRLLGPNAAWPPPPSGRDLYQGGIRLGFRDESRPETIPAQMGDVSGP